MDVLTLFVLPALVGVVIGIMSGLLGIGGGTVMVPIFRLAFGMSPVMSTATSLFAIIPTSISGAASHIRHKTCIVSLGVAAGLGGALTSPLGVWLAQISPAWLIMVAAALIIGWSAVKMLSKAFKLRAQKRAQQEGAGASAEAGADDADPAPAAADPAPRKLTRKQLLIGVAIGLGAGVASGYVGVGGGFIMVPLMLSLIGIEMRQASGTSLIAVMILAIPGVIEQALLGNINYTAGIAIVVGSIPGAVIGARLVRVVPELALRFVFGGFLIVAAIILVLNEFGILG
ncbi:sulfite exporter TauE/SafE family protein [Eggerthella guodeyinii]|uniref:Probable membrane transporter protein n=1 Tax=Eggerthella guodeyinii TaxID=2690837 RepID=A0A6N7RLE5_9ACTN|nr:sulfite exporter TauE/SafE family protein [Eggerthella guodeyinii]MRX81660.1 TSUP family transporter [Eggerthella guodeyinii]